MLNRSWHPVLPTTCNYVRLCVNAIRKNFGCAYQEETKQNGTIQRRTQAIEQKWEELNIGNPQVHSKLIKSLPTNASAVSVVHRGEVHLNESGWAFHGRVQRNRGVRIFGLCSGFVLNGQNLQYKLYQTLCSPNRLSTCQSVQLRGERERTDKILRL